MRVRSTHTRLRGGEAQSTSDAGGTPVGIPNTWELIKFAIPTLGIWVSSPILSLVDSAVVGRYPPLPSDAHSD